MPHRGFDPFEEEGFGFGQHGGAQRSRGRGQSLGSRFLSAASSPLGVSTIAGLGGRFLSYLGGRGERREAKQQLATDRAGLESLLGKDVLRPRDIAFSARTGARRGVGREAELVDRRLGLDVGSAQTDILRGVAGRHQGILADLQVQNALTKARRDAEIRRLLLRESSARFARA